MSTLVQQIHKTNKTSRNVFDISNNVQFSTCPGQLLPIRTDEVLPNDEFRFSMSAFARTVQMLVPSFARVKSHIDAFFVPYRLLGTDFQQIIVGDNRGAIGNYTGSNGSYVEKQPLFPSINAHDLLHACDDSSLSDSAGVKYSISSRLLLNSLGYGVYNQTDASGSSSKAGFSLLDNSSIGSSVNSYKSKGLFSSDFSSFLVNVLPLQAYQKIYQDFYRNKLWEKENRASYYFGPSMNGVKLSPQQVYSNGLIEMRYHDYDKDRITGMIPDENNILTDGVSAYAQDILSALSKGLDSASALGSQQIPSQSVLQSDTSLSVQANKVTTFAGQGGSVGFEGDYFSPVLTTAQDGTDFSPILNRLSALSFRRLQAFQKFAEITDMSKSDYKHQIKAHWGFDVPSLNSDYSQYIGGFDLPLSISSVENNQGSDNLGYLGGKATISGGSRQFKFRASEHGIIMFILYVLPQVDYLNLYTDRSVMRFGRYDFAIPEFDSIGFEPVRVMDVCNSLLGDNSLSKYNPFQVIGYLPRYWYYKTKIDCNASFTFGASSKTPTSSINYNAYIVPFPTSYFLDCCSKGVTYRGYKCLPYILDKLFPVGLEALTTGTPDEYCEAFPFIFTVYFNCSVLRSLSVDGLPY